MKYLISLILRKVPRRYLQLFSHIVLKVVSLFFIGNRVECPVCKKKFRKFLPYGRKNVRTNALCPSCLALERHRLMWLYLSQKTTFFKSPLKVLHIAPEICFIKRFKSLDHLEYVTADLESPLAQVKMDIHQIPFDEHTFDVVFCNHVMEHVDDDIQAMSEIYRVLKKNGWAIIQSPQDMSLNQTYEDKTIITPQAREKAYGQNDHLRTYGQDYGERLRSAGFQVREDKFVQELPDETVARFGLPREEIIYFCMK